MQPLYLSYVILQQKYIRRKVIAKKSSFNILNRKYS